VPEGFWPEAKGKFTLMPGAKSPVDNHLIQIVKKVKDRL
jgi:hypothetical protein